MKHQPSWVWEHLQFLPLIVAMLVYAICRIMSPRFLISRVIFGTLAILFDTFASWLVIRAIWELKVTFPWASWAGS
jgi:hypothetical protein